MHINPGLGNNKCSYQSVIDGMKFVAGCWFGRHVQIRTFGVVCVSLQGHG